MGDASLVLGDFALAQGIDATPRDLALWASAQSGPIGALGVEALGESVWLCRSVAENRAHMGGKHGSIKGSRTWSRSRSRAGSVSRSRKGPHVVGRSHSRARSRSESGDHVRRGSWSDTLSSEGRW